jgi:23S rRNA (guanosine2251-2'-O)-methyltransferase
MVLPDEYIYGLNPAFEVARAGRRPIRRALLEPGDRPGGRVRALRALLERAGVPIEAADKGALFRAAGTREHQGVALLAGPYPYAAFESLLAEPRLLLIDNVEDPQNVGAMLRSAEAFGWNAVLLPNRGVPRVYPSVLKASAGAAEHLRIAQDRSATGYVKVLLERGFDLVALDAAGRESVEALRLDPGRSLALVIGGEHLAVGRHILNQARHVVAIPQQGRVGSLNASVAAGLAMFLLRGQGQARTSPPPPRPRA